MLKFITQGILNDFPIQTQENNNKNSYTTTKIYTFTALTNKIYKIQKKTTDLKIFRYFTLLLTHFSIHLLFALHSAHRA